MRRVLGPLFRLNFICIRFINTSKVVPSAIKYMAQTNEPLNFKKAVVLTKFSRLEFERRRHPNEEKLKEQVIFAFEFSFVPLFISLFHYLLHFIRYYYVVVTMKLSFLTIIYRARIVIILYSV